MRQGYGTDGIIICCLVLSCQRHAASNGVPACTVSADAGACRVIVRFCVAAEGCSCAGNRSVSA